MELTDRQKFIAAAPGDEIAIVARAGAGKTTLVAARIQHMIEHRGIPASSILAITYTRAGGRALRDKIGRVLGHSGTLHSLALKVLGIDPLTILTETEEATLFNDIISLTGVKGVSLTKLKWAMAQPTQPGNIGLLRLMVNQRLEAMGKITFDLVLARFLAMPELERRKAGRYHVIVDEAQDASLIDATIYRRLSSGGSIAVIGDPQQAIYGFRGSSPRWLLEAMPETHGLTQSFRCPELICRAANRLLTNHHMTSSDSRQPAEKPRLMEFENQRDEEDYIIAFAQAKIHQRETLAILARYNHTVTRMRNALRSAGIEIADPTWGDEGDGVKVGMMVGVLRAIAARNYNGLVAAHPFPASFRRHWPEAEGFWRQIEGEPVGRMFALAGCPSNWSLYQGHDSISPEYAIREIIQGTVEEVGAGSDVCVETIHASKGLEWDHVLLMAADAQIDADGGSNPRHLAYVAITRARKSFRATYAIRTKVEWIDRTVDVQPSSIISGALAG